MVYRLPPILRKIRLDHPGIDLTITNTPTPTSVDNIIHNRIDSCAGEFAGPEKATQDDDCFATKKWWRYFPPVRGTFPTEITPSDVGWYNLLVEQQTSAAYALVLGWLSGPGRGTPRTWEPMPLGTVEALKSAVASNLGMAIVPEVAIATHKSDFIVRPLKPALSRTLALIEHRNKPSDPALEIVRNALLGMRTVAAIEPKTARRRRAVKVSGA